MKQFPLRQLFKTKKKIIIFVGLVVFLCAAVFVKTILIKDKYVTVEFLVSGGEWWWDTSHPPYWLGDPIIEGAVEYTIQGKKQAELLEVQKFNEGNRKTIYAKARLLVTENTWTKKYRYKQNPLEIGSTIMLSPNSVQLYANIIGIQGISPERAKMKRTVILRWYDVYPWQADAISVGDKMISSDGDVHATILDKTVTNAEKTTVTSTNSQIINRGAATSTMGLLFISQQDPLKRDVTLTVEITTTRESSSEVFAYYLPVKVGDILIINLPKIIITPFIIDIK